jgi:hypothetical protein
MYNYAHVDLYSWLDSKSKNISNRIRRDDCFAEFAGIQERLAFELLAAWKPKIVICPYKIVEPSIRRFCEDHNQPLDLQFLPLTGEKILSAETILPWGNTLVLVCQNLLGRRGNIGVGPIEWPNIRDAIVNRCNKFLINHH